MSAGQLDQVRAELAPTGVLRAAINMGNPLLVTSRAANGDPQGVSPDMARAIANELGVDVRYVPYPTPGELGDALARDEWDIGLIAIEPARAQMILFSQPYVEIEATYLVAADAPYSTVESVDAAGVKIAVSSRSAYDLYLTRTLKNAELVRGPGLPGAYELFVRERPQALAGLRPALLEDAQKMKRDHGVDARVLDGKFTAVTQAIGTRHANKNGAAFIDDFVARAKTSGFVAQLIEKHGVTGRLAVAS